jgi:WD40 repeat protein
MRSLYGSVRAGDTTGSATVKLSFDAWTAGRVAATTQTLSIQPPPPKAEGPPAEPVSDRLVATLPHPARKSSIAAVRYSPDGQRLLVAGDMYSGVVQLWDVASRKEVLKIAGPKHTRGNNDPSFLAEEYALLSPDGKTVYVPTRGEKRVRVERDGKKTDRFDMLGVVRRWDVASKKELAPFTPPAGLGNFRADLSPDGRFLHSVELKSWFRGESDTSVLAVWDTAAGKRSVIDTKGGGPMFLPDGTGLAILTAAEGKFTVTVHGLPDGTKLREKTHPGTDGKDGWPRLAAVAGDGTLAVNLGGKKGKPTTTLFLDANTLDEVGRWTGPANPFGFGHTAGTFTPDGKRFLVVDGENTLHVWDVAAKKAVRTVKLSGSSPRLVVSGDGKWFAHAWTPDRDKLPHGPEVEPDALPQPRVELLDLTDADSKPVTLICPRGIAWGLAFRPDGKQLAVGGTGAVHLFELK